MPCQDLVFSKKIFSIATITIEKVINGSMMEEGGKKYPAEAIPNEMLCAMVNILAISNALLILGCSRIKAMIKSI